MGLKVAYVSDEAIEKDGLARQAYSSGRTA